VGGSWYAKEVAVGTQSTCRSTRGGASARVRQDGHLPAMRAGHVERNTLHGCKIFNVTVNVMVRHREGFIVSRLGFLARFGKKRGHCYVCHNPVLS
jgi:hypothetical protein